MSVTVQLVVVVLPELLFELELAAVVELVLGSGSLLLHAATMGIMNPVIPTRFKKSFLCIAEEI